MLLTTTKNRTECMKKEFQQFMEMANEKHQNSKSLNEYGNYKTFFMININPLLQFLLLMFLYLSFDFPYLSSSPILPSLKDSIGFDFSGWKER